MDQKISKNMEESPGQLTPGHDHRLMHINNLIEDARRLMLRHDPGTRAQEQAWVKLKHLLGLKDRGVMFIPKF